MEQINCLEHLEDVINPYEINQNELNYDGLLLMLQLHKELTLSDKLIAVLQNYLHRQDEKNEDALQPFEGNIISIQITSRGRLKNYKAIAVAFFITVVNDSAMNQELMDPLLSETKNEVIYKRLSKAFIICSTTRHMQYDNVKIVESILHVFQNNPSIKDDVKQKTTNGEIKDTDLIDILSKYNTCSNEEIQYYIKTIKIGKIEEMINVNQFYDGINYKFSEENIDYDDEFSDNKSPLDSNHIKENLNSDSKNDNIPTHNIEEEHSAYSPPEKLTAYPGNNAQDEVKEQILSTKEEHLIDNNANHNNMPTETGIMPPPDGVPSSQDIDIKKDNDGDEITSIKQSIEEQNLNSGNKLMLIEGPFDGSKKPDSDNQPVSNPSNNDEFKPDKPIEENISPANQSPIQEDNNQNQYSSLDNDIAQDEFIPNNLNEEDKLSEIQNPLQEEKFQVTDVMENPLNQHIPDSNIESEVKESIATNEALFQANPIPPESPKQEENKHDDASKNAEITKM
jgi:hypothetical protein